MKLFTKVILISFLMTLFATAALAAGPSPEAIENANTAADHEAIARAYDAEAKDLRAKAANHQKMGARYAKTPSYQKMAHGKPGMEAHCKRLAASLDSAAADAEALAATHWEMAKEAGN